MAFSGDRDVNEEIEFDSNGTPLALSHGTIVPNMALQSGYPFVGFDPSGSAGGVARLLRADNTGSLFITGSVGISGPVIAYALIQGVFQTGSFVTNMHPVLISGADSTGIMRNALVDVDGAQIVNHKEEPTFFFAATNIAVTTNKSMLSVVNQSSNALRIREIRLINVRTTAVTGVVGVFELRRIAGHSAGTLVVGEVADTSDSSMTASMSVRTGATVFGEGSSLLFRSLWSTDEWSPGTADTESYDHSVMQTFPLYSSDARGTKPITLRQNQGMTLKQTTANVGTFDVMLTFTVS